ncbi:DUF1572 family protein [Fulvivirga sp. 29W222]|uniref:DUF1572 family protein n=1 Tax=Fulvivirga marina TaxID=2494733 RepID=A0A937KCB3_9BACT|nr:DUF1572 family protein [Fulvivirga marina]MBL6444785.1 DUF1572 family protein [Fulvivirga marina]
MLDSLKKLYERDLDALINEIQSFNKKENLWSIRPGVSNSAGNLALHICGNLKHFIGTGIGQTGYIRQRELEFSQKNVPIPELIKNINETKQIVTSALSKISPETLASTYPITLRGEAFGTEYFLLHLHAHLNYHLGQINYLRRLIEG